MALQFDGTNYLTAAARPLTGTISEFTVFCWWFTVSDPAGLIGIAGDNTLSSRPGHTFWIDNADGARTDMFAVDTNDGAGVQAGMRGDSESVVNGTWQTVISTWKRNDNHHFYVDGVEQGDSPVATADSDYDVSTAAFSVGNRPTIGGAIPRDGDRIAELAYWLRVLTAQEITALTSGAAPLFFGGGLTWYNGFRTVGDLTDLIGGNTLTEQGAGALTTGEHPPIVYPMTMPWSRQAAGGAVTVTAITSLDAAIQRNVTAFASLDAAVQRTRTQAASLDAAVAAVRNAVASLDAAVARTVSASASLDAAVRTEVTAETALDAAISRTMAQTVSLDALIARAASVVASLDAAVAITRSQTVDIDAAVRATRTLSLSLDALIALSTTQVIVSLDAAIQIERSVAAVIDAAVSASVMATVSLDAAVSRTGTASIEMDAWIAMIRTQAVSLDAAILGTVTASVSLDAFISGTVSPLSPSAARTFKAYRGRSFAASPRRGFKVPEGGRFH
jgi:hypothetical protein